jgi:beta-glucosidase-like glycosyl hydrolase/CubicO group peptidase (beta-lactamase class C family)
MFLKKTLFLVSITLFFSLTIKKNSEIKRNFRTEVIPIFLQSDNSWAEKTLASMTLEEKIGQFFMVATWSNKNEEHHLEIENLIKKNKIGGLIYFQGNEKSLKKSIQRMQLASKIPLLIGMDAEWGAGMRLNEMDRFPYAYTIGAANDTVLSEKIGEMMAQECKELGIHINFAPVADINSNPKNPVIGFRSFGENSQHVANHVAAMVRGMEKNGILTSIKHFPGHGDTDKDSHYELPTVSHSKNQFENIDFLPFKAGINAGASTVMVGHLNVPFLDDSKTPSSLSKNVIQEYLKKSLNFKGLVVSDALNMKAVADKYGQIDVVVKAFEAGNDILLFPENVDGSIKALVEKVKAGEISLDEINTRCLKILEAKNFAFNHKSEKAFTKEEIIWAKKDTYEKAITLLKNSKDVLPLVDSKAKIAFVSVGIKTASFKEMSRKFHDLDAFHFFSFQEAKERMKNIISKYDVIVTSIHPKSVSTSSNFYMPGNIDEWSSIIPEEKEHIVIHFGNPNALSNIDLSNIDAMALAYENHKFAQEAMAQFVFGAIGSVGKTQLTISTNFPFNSGLVTLDAKRLKYSQAEEFGIRASEFDRIDAIVMKAIQAKAFPGCQVLVALEGKIIYQKSFGTLIYEDTTKVNENHVYDIASISKIVGSTAALMRLESLNKFSLDSTLNDYLPELVGNSNKKNIIIKNMMAHQVGFTPWIAFYKETVQNGKLIPSIYSNEKNGQFSIPVAKDVWIRNDYPELIYDKILKSALTKKPKYEYSDLGYYFVKKIVEKQAEIPFDNFMFREFFDPMGLKNIRYNPLLFFPKDRIAPTENDLTFRGKLVHGFVHDPGAAMLGGVGGHAGVFSNSVDLAAMMQLFLNEGIYANRRYIKSDIVKNYTKAQLNGNRRGAGFDRPTPNAKDGPTCSLVSQESYGHSGFTGTFTWADPKYGINYVFLSNRVYPDASNKKIQEMHTRSDIQKVIYEVILNAKKEGKIK